MLTSTAIRTSSQKLLASFRGFIARGSIDDINHLLSNLGMAAPALCDSGFPKDPKLNNSATLRPSNTAVHGMANETTIACAPKSFSATAEQAMVHGQSGTGLQQSETYHQEAWQFFASRVPTNQRHHSLMRALLGHLQAPHQSFLTYRALWSSHRQQIFSHASAAESRLSRLFQGRRVIDQENHRFECASRLSLVFLSHDIEVVKDQEWKLGPGQSRQHAAVLSVAHHLGVNPDEIKKEWRRSRNYMLLLEACGPGSLLELGTGVNW